MNSELPIEKTPETVSEFLNRIQDTALAVLLKTGYHPGLLIVYWRTKEIFYNVNHYIEDSKFHRYMETWENKDYALICIVEEGAQEYLMVEVWLEGWGIRNLIPFKLVNGIPVVEGRERLIVLQKGCEK